MINVVSVKELYELAQKVTPTIPPLLSDYDAEFWEEYLDNYQSYDKMFARMFYSFKYYDLLNADDNILTDFTNDVKNVLMLNRKKYEELYRVYTIEDEDYNIKSNVDIEEQENENINASGSFVSGQRQDSESIGAQINTSEEEVSAFDSNGYQDSKKTTDNIGAQSNSTTKGAETDTNTTQQIDSRTKTTKGSNGQEAVSSLLGKHNKLWNAYEFYTLIFKDISRELLNI